ncbi:MAG: hypothetical protein ACKO2G_06065 [Verrucomicrobiales bacterium]
MKMRTPAIMWINSYRVLTLLAGACCALPLFADDAALPIQVRERVAPWGTVVSRERFYVKEGQKVEHGLQEAYATDGKPSWKLRFLHGREHGIQEFFY